MAWRAKSGCAEHHRAAVERIANERRPTASMIAPALPEPLPPGNLPDQSDTGQIRLHTASAQPALSLIWLEALDPASTAETTGHCEEACMLRTGGAPVGPPCRN